MSYLRPSHQAGAKHSWAILALLVKRLRQQWPEVTLCFRGDSGFCRHRMLSWCERHHVTYIVGLAKNARLNALTQELQTKAQLAFDDTQEKQRLFDAISYAAGSWSQPRRVIIKAEHTAQGANPRYIVTNCDGPAQELYDHVYCARGDMENRIKEQQLDLFADRTSCHRWWANQFRLLLSSAAYILVSAIRRIALKDTLLAKACCATIRLKLFKIGSVMIRNTRRVKFLLSSSYPYQDLFRHIAAQLIPG